MEVWLFFGLVIVGLIYLARNKAGPGDRSDIAAQRDIPSRPGRVIPQSGRPGYEPIDHTRGDVGVRPRYSW